jgi:hypothetical protein
MEQEREGREHWTALLAQGLLFFEQPKGILGVTLGRDRKIDPLELVGYATKELFEHGGLKLILKNSLNAPNRARIILL